MPNTYLTLAIERQSVFDARLELHECYKLKTWDPQASGAVLCKPAIVTRHHNCQKAHAKTYSTAINSRFFQLSLYIGRDITFDGRHGSFFTKSRVALRQSFRGQKFFRTTSQRKNACSLELRLPPTHEHADIDFPCVAIGPFEYRNYYHWITEGLSKVVLARDSLCASFPILIPEDAPRFVLDSLSFVGVSQNCVHFYDPSLCYKLHQVYFFTTPSPSVIDFHPAIFTLTRSMAESAQAISHKALPKRILINRRGKRAMLPTQDLMKLQHTLNLTEMFLEDLSFAEQVYLFRNADLIVGPHGAGLTNTLFSSEATVVEIIPHSLSHISPYWPLSTFAGNYYIAHITSSLQQNQAGFCFALREEDCSTIHEAVAGACGRKKLGALATDRTKLSTPADMCGLRA